MASKLMETDPRGAFRGTDPATREEAAKTFVRLAEMCFANLHQTETAELSDIAQLSNSSREFVIAAVRSGLLTADNERFRPTDNLTREEAAIAIYRVIGFSW